MKSVVVRFIAIIALLAIITNARKLDTKNNKFTTLITTTGGKNCKPGYHYTKYHGDYLESHVRTSKMFLKNGHCLGHVSALECKNVANANGFKFKETMGRSYPPGCYSLGSSMYFNQNKDTGIPCGTSGRVCFCKSHCTPCPENHYSDGGQALCKPCRKDQFSNAGSAACQIKTEVITGKLTNLKEQMDKMKEERSDSHTNLERLYQDMKVRKAYETLMLSKQKNEKELTMEDCKRDRKMKTLLFPSVELKEEVDDNTCINKNRDMLISEFCNFRSNIQAMLDNLGVKVDAKKEFWPKICCKKRIDRDNLEKCASDPTIVPFAGSQGGKVTGDNLYDEVKMVLKPGGYLQTGFLDLFTFVENFAQKSHTMHHHVQMLKQYKNQVISLFQSNSLCGPRTVRLQNGNMMCQLFMPYERIFSMFTNTAETVMEKVKNDFDKYVALIEKEASTTKLHHLLTKRSHVNVKLKVIPSGMSLKAKQGGAMNTAIEKTEEKTCKILSKDTNTAKAAEFCKGYTHLDVKNTNVINIAMQYIQDNIAMESDKEMVKVASRIKWKITDSCPSKLFTADDILLQQVKNDFKGMEKEWVAVVKLNDVDEYSYLKHELKHCAHAKFLPRAQIEVKSYLDNDGCCDDINDYDECVDKQKSSCTEKIRAVIGIDGKPMNFGIDIFGSVFEVKGNEHHARLLNKHIRRRLLGRGFAVS